MEAIAATLSQCGHTSAGAGLQFFALLIQTIYQQQCSISPPTMWPQDFGPTALSQGLPEYDYIIIGAGSGGSVVANRLSENPNHKILVIEAGGNPPIESEIPIYTALIQKTPYTWNYFTEKTTYASLGLPLGSYWPRGKLLGGTGAINAMLYVRGNRRDYNLWKQLGNPTWGWDDVLPYFKKSEDNNVIINKYHGQGGLLKVNKYNGTEILTEVFIDAASECGLKELRDVNGEKHIGYTRALGTLIDGTRCSPAKAFLIPAMGRPNLHIIKNALVTKINISPAHEATGVEFVLGGQTLTATMKKEVVLSAGAINSPQLLMLSGVGPASELNKHSIPVKKDLPVGENLQDHPVVPYIFSFHKSTATVESTSELVDYVFQYINTRSGPFATFTITELIGFVNTENKTDPFPDIQYHHFYFRKQSIDLDFALNIFGYDEKISASIKKANQDYDLVAVFVTLLNPKSIGNVKLRSADPTAAPIINAEYLKLQEDVKTIVRGIKVVRKFLKTKAFIEHEAGEVKIDIPKCNALKPYSDEFFECYVRHSVTTMYHPVGTVKMGAESDPTAVVDPRLRVKGVKKLRVVDASIMPTIPSGNTNAPTIMIGEKASDMIKADA